MIRHGIKALAFGTATLLVLPELLSFWLRARLLGRDRALEGSSQMLALVPGLLGQYVRRAFYSRTLRYCHPSVTVEAGTFFTKADSSVGEGVYIGPRCQLGLVTIERGRFAGGWSAGAQRRPDAPLRRGNDTDPRPAGPSANGPYWGRLLDRQRGRGDGRRRLQHRRWCRGRGDETAAGLVGRGRHAGARSPPSIHRSI